jgi:tetratricopeptide (TPR) repeat protein
MIQVVRRTAFCVWLGLMMPACAQDLDTAVFAKGRKPATILDQIEDRGERKAFSKLYNEHEAAARRSLAAKFLADYPASWLLAEVYEIASKACIDLGDTRCAVEMGQQSLRLFPENPLLLVPLATAQFQSGLLEQSKASASDALDLLDRFAGPAAMRPAEWTELAAQLRASSYYTLGRVYSIQGLAESGANRRRLLEQALEAVHHAVESSPNDPELVYLRGLMLLALGKFNEASVDFRVVAARSSPVQERARAQLKKLNLPVEPAGAASADASTAKTTAAMPPTAAGYAGSKACQKCHATEYEAWKRTGMARMLRAYRPENVIGDFTSQGKFAGSDGNPVAFMKVDHDRHVFQIRGSDGVWHRYPVDYTIGSKWQQAYATRLADGRIQVFPIQYNALKHEWIDYWQRIDPVGSERADIPSFNKMSESANYQRNCAPCHTSQFGASPGQDPNHPGFLEGGINCEMCHGPSAFHAVESRQGQANGKRPLEPPVDFTKIGHRDAVRICAQCHMQSAIRDSAGVGVSGEFPPRYPQRPYNEFLRKAFYKDGRFRETTFIVESFVRSQCFRKGQAQCGSCHDPHRAGQGENHTSFKFASNPDEMCLQCHAQYRDNPERHTHHRALSEGGRCQACHMPRIMNSLLFEARSHQIDDIPAAEQTLRFGVAESPIACLECHPAKTVASIQSELRSWKGVRAAQLSHASP